MVPSPSVLIQVSSIFCCAFIPLRPLCAIQCSYELPSEGTSEGTAAVEHCIQLLVEYIFMLEGFILHLFVFIDPRKCSQNPYGELEAECTKPEVSIVAVIVVE